MSLLLHKSDFLGIYRKKVALVERIAAQSYGGYEAAFSVQKTVVSFGVGLDWVNGAQ